MKLLSLIFNIEFVNIQLGTQNYYKSIIIDIQNYYMKPRELLHSKRAALHGPKYVNNKLSYDVQTIATSSILTSYLFAFDCPRV